MKGSDKAEKVKKMKNMTRIQLIEACVDEQIRRGVAKPENRQMQIRVRMEGTSLIPAMRKKDAQRWYNVTFENAAL